MQINWQFQTIPSLDSEGAAHKIAHQAFKRGCVVLNHHDLHHDILKHFNLSLLDQAALSRAIGFFSSGSTGLPRIVLHHKESLIQSAQISVELIQSLNPSSSPIQDLYSSLPLFHVGGFLNILRPLSITKKITKSSLVVGVPTMLHDLIAHPEEVSPHLFYCGGGHCSDRLVEKANERGIQVIRTYGQTESAGAILYQYNQGKVKPFPDCEVKIQNGYLQYRSSRQAYAYLDHKGLKKSEQWIITEDLASFHQGSYRIHGRADRIIICGGENIDLNSVEKKLKVLIPHPLVLNAFEDERLGSIPVAFIKASAAEVAALTKSDHPLFKKSPERPRAYLTWPSHQGIKPSFEDFRLHFEKYKKEHKKGYRSE